MRIASYNIRKAVGLDWRRDPARILAVLEEIDADVVLLQEADRRFGSRAGVLPAEALGDMGYRFAPVNLRPASHGWHGNAILSRLRTERPQRLHLPSLEPRGAVAARVAGVTVVGVHLGLTPRTRTRQLSTLESRFPEGPVVIGGDFNMWRGRKGEASHFRLLAPGPSFHASRPTVALDRFALLGVSHASAHVHHSPAAARASDHLPIVLDLQG
ncbi:endonuclease/exonuclease/phosphatase family protein [Vannielia litorea]|uniref:Metal-dependent hydrolase, endonuclease/exonuclease/phosphatase family n=1 Tax=Vannielia litorea TaxID=1217970 RepID=A0A1N6ERK7_9RHOB|nr:endonuclease/exonuclease/phosphatase family protein [Vannielia litorea]SIN85732.1 Metal-dependent hydrolase, endonuclease/exonuclease/phosphatase family [Vannielia litorea]